MVVIEKIGRRLDMFGDMAMESMNDNIYDDTCWLCDGTGKTIHFDGATDVCEICNGSGKIIKEGEEQEDDWDY